MKDTNSRSLVGWRVVLCSAVTAMLAALAPVGTASAATVPGAPTNVQTELYTSGVSVTWNAPADNGGSAITDYAIERAPTNTGPWTVIPDGVGAWTNVGLGSLVAGQTYWLRITAVNAVGPGTPSTPVSFVFGSVPAKPTGLTVTPSADKTLTLTWDADLNNFGDTIVDFIVEQADSPDGPWSVVTDGVSPAKSASVGGLTAGQTYWYRVKGVSGQATGQPCDPASGTAISAPLAVTGLSVIATGTSSVRLSWTQDTQGGTAPVTGWLVTMATDVAGPYAPVAAVPAGPSSADVNGLTPRLTCYFIVQTQNPAGTSPPVDPVSTTPGEIPEAPQLLTVTPGNARLTVSWLPPVDDGGNPLGGYQVSYAVAGTGAWTDTVVLADVHTISITSLLNGTAYDVKVVAMNQLGMGPAATATAAPRTVPGAPLGLKATARSKAVALSWLLPSSTGGAALTNYVVQKATTKAGPWRAVTHPVSTARKLTVKDLKPGKRYFFRVSAVNAAGRGAWSAVVSSVPRR